MIYCETEAKIAEALVPLLDKVAPAMRQAGGLPQVPGGLFMGYAATATGDGVAVGRRVHAPPGMICIDVAWLREIVALEDQRKQILAANLRQRMTQPPVVSLDGQTFTAPPGGTGPAPPNATPPAPS